jgi:hypothetical protein
MSRPSSLGWLAVCVVTASACGGPARVAQGPSPPVTGGIASPASDFVPFDAQGKAGPLCFSSGVLPSIALRLDAGGRYVALMIGDLHDVGIDDEGSWIQPKPGTIALDSDRWVPGYDAGVIGIDRIEASKLTATYPRLRDGLKSLLAAHPETTFARATLKALDGGPLLHIEDDGVPRHDVEAALAELEKRLASDTPRRVIAEVGTYRGVTWLTRSDDDPATLSRAKPGIDELLAKEEAKPWIADGTSPFYTLVASARCRMKPNI